MKNRSLYAVLTRFGIVAAVLTALLVIAPAATAQTDESCSVNSDGVLECDYEENGTDPIATLTSADPEGAGVTWSTRGTDGSLFSAEGGVLMFKSSPDYEAPGDAMHTVVDEDGDTNADFDGDADNDDENNVHVFIVRATEVVPDDQEEPAQYEEILVRVTVTNMDEPGMASILVRQPQVGVALTATASDPDTRDENDNEVTDGTGTVAWTWSVPKVSRPVTGNDDHWIAGVGATSGTGAETYTPAAGDIGSILRAQATYTDGTGEERTLNVLTEYPVRAAPDANDAPNAFDSGDTDRSVNENSPNGTLVGAPVTTTDSNPGDVLYYTLSGDDEASFAIDKVTGQITVDGDVNHEGGDDFNDSVYDVTVTAIDPSGMTTTVEIDITANDVNEKPTVTEAEDAVKITPEINSTPPDPADYDYADDNDLDNLNYRKHDIDDGDETEFSLAGDDAGQFNMAVADDVLTLSFKSPPDYDKPGDADKDNTYKVSVVATDKAGLAGMADVEIVVTDVAEVGTVTVSPDQPAIGRPVTATLNEPDTEVSGLKWQWESSSTKATGATWTPIDGADSDTYIPTAGSPAVPDDPATPGVDESVAEVPSDEGMFLRAVATYTDKPSPDENDDGDPDEQEAMGDSMHAVRAQPDVNNPPAFESATIDREVREDTASGGNAGDAVKATDPDGDSLTYSITGGPDMDKFGIEGQGQITVGSAELDFEDGQRAFEVEVTASDPFGLSGSTLVTITVTDFNEAPDFTAEDPDDYAENGEGAVATFTASDPEGTDIIWSTGGTDGSKFSIDGGVLTFSSSPNYEMPGDADHPAGGTDDPADAATNNTYVLNVRAAETAPEDSEDPAKYTEHQIRVEVTNVDEMGEIDINWRQPQVGEDLFATTSDPDTRDDEGNAVARGTGPVAWQWSVPKVNRPDTDNNDHWNPAGNTANTGATYQPVDSDIGSVLRAQATYTDGTGEERTLNILTEFAVRAAPASNDDPNAFDSTDNTRSVNENAPEGTPVGPPVTTTDSNAGDILTYTITDASNTFAIDKVTGQITVVGDVDHETGGTDGVYTVTVSANDPSLDTAAQIAITITANDVNEKPTVAEADDPVKITPEIDSTPENPATYTYVSALANLTYTKADVDDGDETTFSLAGDDAGQFNMAVADDELTLSFKSDPDYDKPGDADKDNTYKVSVVATDKAGLAGMADVEIVVTDVSEAGTVTLSPAQPAIGRPVTATLNEPDTEVSGLKWQWQSSDTGATDDFADIEDATGDTYTPRDAVPDDETTPDIDESMDSDEGLFLRAVATYIDAAAPLNTDTADDLEDQVEQDAMGDSVHAVRAEPEVNGAPAFESASMMREVEENTASGGDVGGKVEATDPDGDVLTYEITGGADMDKFGNTGAQITVGSATLDYEEGQRTFEVELTATDPFGLSGSTMVTITVTDVNEKPTGIGLTPPAPAENVAPAFADDAATAITVMENVAGDIGDAYTASDPGDDVSYSVSGSMDITVDDAGQLSTTGLDYEAAASVTVTITAMDDEGLSDTIDVTITVGDAHPGCTVADNNGLTSDCEALLDIKGDLEGAAGASLNWDENTPIEMWEGMQGHYLYPSLSGDPMRVTALHIQRQSLDGMIPDDISRLGELKALWIWGNSLHGDLSALSGLPKLERVYANNNELDALGDLSGATSLQILWAHRNEDMAGPLMADYLPASLTWVSLYSTALGGEIPDLSALTSLERLYLDKADLTGQVPASLGSVTSLTHLRLKWNDLSGQIPAELDNLTNLVWVRINKNNFTGCVPEALTDAGAGNSDAEHLGLPTCGIGQ